MDKAPVISTLRLQLRQPLVIPYLPFQIDYIKKLTAEMSLPESFYHTVRCKEFQGNLEKICVEYAFLHS